MPIVMFMSFMIMMYLGVTAFAETSYQKDKEDMGSFATSMALYHTYAVRQCTKPNTCPAGPITIVNLPGGMVDMSSMSNKFASHTDGAVIVTTLTPAFYLHIANELSSFNNSLNVETQDSVLSGPYVPGDTAVISDMSHKVVRLADGTRQLESGMLTLRLRSVPSSVGGVNLVAGQPTMVTPIY